MRKHLRELLTQAIEKAAKGGGLNSSELPPLLLEPPKQREFGATFLDKFSGNVAWGPHGEGGVAGAPWPPAC